MEKIFIIMFVLMALFMIGCSKETDALKFKAEYENLNGEEVGNNDKKYMTIEIDDKNPIVYSNYEEVFETFNSTGIIYFGFPACPWCRNAVPVLLEAADEAEINKIYYLNNLSDRDIKTLDENGNLITEKEGTEKYNKLLDLLAEYASEYNGLNDSKIKRLYFPTVVFIKDGEIIYAHVATVDSQEDPYTSLTKEQHNELKDIYVKYMKEIKDGVCDIGIPC